MTKKLTMPQLLAVANFLIENIFLIGVILHAWFSPNDKTSIPTTSTLSWQIWLFIIVALLIFQIVAAVAILRMEKHQGWLIVLALIALIHDPLYFIPVIWSFATNKKYPKKSDFH